MIVLFNLKELFLDIESDYQDFHKGQKIKFVRIAYLERENLGIKG